MNEFQIISDLLDGNAEPALLELGIPQSNLEVASAVMSHGEILTQLSRDLGLVPYVPEEFKPLRQVSFSGDNIYILRNYDLSLDCELVVRLKDYEPFYQLNDEWLIPAPRLEE